MRKLSWFFGVAGLLLAPLLGAGAPAETTQRSFYLIITGGELLEGALADAHTPFITRTLLPLGMKCVGVSIVDDLDEDLMAAVGHATNKAHLVIVTGGLGPTDNDITRQTLSRCTGIALKENPDLLRDMARRFGTPEGELRPNLRRQTEVPVRGGYLKNSVGTAAGLIFDLAEGHIVALPGPPRELQTMVREQLVPFLMQHYGIRARASSLMVRFLGVGQSQIDHTMKQKIKLPPGLIVGSTFDGSRVDFTFTLPEDSAAAREALEGLKEQLKKVLGDNIYAFGPETLEEVICRQLKERGWRLAVVEMGSGGSVMAALGRAPGAGEALAQGWTAMEEAALWRGLNMPAAQWQAATAGPERLKLAAETAAKLAGTECVLVVGPAQPAGSGSATLTAGLKAPGGRWVEQNFVFRTGAENQPALVTQIMGFLWKKLP
ncbi:MAG: molybdopterin-binding protein [Verrucomicrobiae bacterium]|nr:molybdopterin-binding protein [Verrucomicrobiae bacterium]